MTENRPSLLRQPSKQIVTISHSKIKQWLELISKEDEMFEESLEIVKKELFLKQQDLQFVFRSVSKPLQILQNPNSFMVKTQNSSIERIVRLINELYAENDLSKRAKKIQQAQELSIKAGYITSILTTRLVEANTLWGFVTQKRYNQALKQFDSLYNTLGSLRGFAVQYVVSRVCTGMLILKLKMGTDSNTTELFDFTINIRSIVRRQYRKAVSIIKEYNRRTIFICVKQIEHLCSEGNFEGAMNRIDKYLNQSSPFGNQSQLLKLFRKRTQKVYNLMESMSKKSVEEMNQLLNEEKDTNDLKIKPRCQSLSIITRSSSVRTEYRRRSRQENLSGKSKNKQKRIIFNPSHPFFRKPPEPPTSKKIRPTSIYNQLRQVKQNKVTNEDIKKQVLDIRQSMKHQNMMMAMEVLKNSSFRTSNHNIMKKSKLGVKRAQANKQSLQQEKLIKILNLRITNPIVHFVFFNVERVEFIQMKIQGNQQAFFVISAPGLLVKHKFKKQDCEINQQFRTEWPAVKYLFKKWMRKDEVLRGIDRSICINDFQVEQDDELSSLKKSEINQISQLRDIVKTFIKLTSYSKRKKNGRRTLLSNSFDITKLFAKSQLKSYKNIIQEKQIQISTQMVEQIIKSSPNPIMVQIIDYNKNSYMHYAFELNVKFLSKAIVLQKTGLSYLMPTISAKFKKENLLTSTKDQSQQTQNEEIIFVPVEQFKERLLQNGLPYHLLALLIYGKLDSCTTKIFINYFHKYILKNHEPDYFKDHQQSYTFNFEQNIHEHIKVTNTFSMGNDVLIQHNINVTEDLIKMTSKYLRKATEKGIFILQDKSLKIHEIFGREVKKMHVHLNSKNIFRLQMIPNRYSESKNYNEMSLSDPIFSSLVDNSIPLHYSIKIDNTAFQLSAKIYQQVYLQNRITQSLEWAVSFHFFTNKKCMKLQLTNRDFLKYFSKKANSLEQIVNITVSRLKLYKNSPYTRVGITIPQNSQLLANEFSSRLNKTRFYAFNNRLLFKIHQFRTFICSKVVAFEKKYAVVILYRMDSFLGYCYQIEVNFVGNEIWAGKVCLCHFLDDSKCDFGKKCYQYLNQNEEIELWRTIFKQSLQLFQWNNRWTVIFGKHELDLYRRLLFICSNKPWQNLNFKTLQIQQQEGELVDNFLNRCNKTELKWTNRFKQGIEQQQKFKSYYIKQQPKPKSRIFKINFQFQESCEFLTVDENQLKFAKGKFALYYLSDIIKEKMGMYGIQGGAMRT